MPQKRNGRSSFMKRNFSNEAWRENVAALIEPGCKLQTQSSQVEMEKIFAIEPSV
jgi:hypothetical protein